MTTIECTHKLNRNKGQVSKASDYQVMAEGGVAPLGRGSAFSQIQFRFRVPEGETLSISRVYVVVKSDRQIFHLGQFLDQQSDR
jgi:hypothetical protein